MSKRVPAMAATYVRVARRLARKYATRPISSAEVSWHTHNKARYASDFDFNADKALAESGLFERANFINSNAFHITLWREKAVA